ncbi:beta/alpha barrel domain-containing protein [Limnovirga soli]|uniref:Bifunctional 4-hydroxy-2-oxoglutarate aldolase/2-dehydro-3-deoxy-phosphogluconate aldolase n=1 Tax=Limnovirga soli TaxID=2656915 RepID=A0A8J8JRE4_9BACT|nr:bifunctional 4-hydroxy-2-oxoglutarate aldolase/2-dehydro-3-deoxy-phosphogluconate aldolase [Limnovirga soli]NNV55772.1 bifunctional 4-hydroxy-2-oxoglutarate aldolase/2-dehydro-3-deoxy-phosphogluconate aldolase [Limnovirga soli]
MRINKTIITEAIIQQGMLPLFYTDSVKVSLEIIGTLYKAGIRVIEYTNRGVAALENFRLLKDTLAAEAPNLYLGIGTIKSVDQARDFIAAGADFIVAPIVQPDVAALVSSAGLAWVPGCMTPSEIYRAQELGASLIKIFPANILGPAFISAVKELFPGQLFMPTGGVSVNKDNLASWFNSGVCAVGMGSKLISTQILEHELYDELFSETQKALALIAEVRSEIK